jgi:hypothetical protein
VLSRLARNAVKARFAAAWESKLDAIVATFGDVSAADKARLAQIDWTASSKQVFMGQVSIEAIENTTAKKWPVVILFAAELNHDGLEKFANFSGSSVVNLEFHFSWIKSAALPNFDETMDLIEEAVLGVMHDKSWLGALDDGLTYTGQMSATRGAVQESGENWTQAISFRFTFGIDV